VRALVRDLRAWFARERRDLPWRVGPAGRRDPYLVLVSEVMLQQTQVARVAEKFPGFVERFPTVRALASASEEDVLGAWTGLGYYRRARMLHGAAKHAVAWHGGEIPAALAELRAMPGVGAYTAGAVASLAHGVATPVVDTNVARVLLRVGGKELATDDPRAMAWAWSAAGALVGATAGARAGECNESLMELGALVCTSRSPNCERCPIRGHCGAFASGRQRSIPRPKRAARRSGVRHVCLIVRDGKRVLIEQRPRDGLWGGLWQLPTRGVEPKGDGARGATTRDAAMALARGLGLVARRGGVGGARAPGPQFVRSFTFKTTHRDVEFVVWRWIASAAAIRLATPAQAHRRWCTREEALALGMSSPMRRLIEEETRDAADGASLTKGPRSR
jgi:A/G-specific adenine glycosylase